MGFGIITENHNSCRYQGRGFSRQVSSNTGSIGQSNTDPPNIVLKTSCPSLSSFAALLFTIFEMFPAAGPRYSENQGFS